MKPHQTFEFTRADEVAECWNGVPEQLYIKLWNEIVPLQAAIPNLEDSGPHDHIGHENLASHWHLLTESEQQLLNSLADAQEAEFKQWLAESDARSAAAGGSGRTRDSDSRLAWFDDESDLSDPCAADRADNAFLADLGDLEAPADLESAAAPAAAGSRDMRGQLATADDARAFALAGKSTLTLVSLKTGNRFTYSIRAAADGMAYFVGLLTGPDNSADYSYLGRIAVRPAGAVFYAGRKVPKPGDVGPDAPSSRAFAWFWRALAKRQLPEQLQVWHEGRCGRCGRKLTVPQSVAQGFGPECVDKVFSS